MDDGGDVHDTDAAECIPQAPRADINMILEKLAQVSDHPSQRGFIRGRNLLTSVVELDAVVAGFLYDDEAEPAAVLLDIAAAFPGAEWEYIRCALTSQADPAALVDALFALYGPTHIEVRRNGHATGRPLRVTREIRQGCHASGIVWALLHDPIARSMWPALPRDELRLTAFADDAAVAMRTVFRDLSVLRHFMEVVRSVTGPGLNADNSAVINFTRRTYLVVHDIACGGPRTSRRLGSTASAVHLRNYNAFVVSVITHIAQLVRPGATTYIDS